MQPARGDAHASRWSAACGGIRREPGDAVRHPRAARTARMTQAEFAAVLRKELNAYPRPARGRAGSVAAGFTAQRGFPVEFSVRGSDWDKLVDRLRRSHARSWLQAAWSSTSTPTTRSGMPELRITPDRARAADLGRVRRGRGDDHQRAGRRHARRQVQLAAAGASTCGCACSPTQRSRPRTSRACACAHGSASWCRCPPLVTHEERPALQAITRRDRERAITIFANVAARPLAGRGAGDGRGARQATCPSATAWCWAAPASPSASR